MRSLRIILLSTVGAAALWAPGAVQAQAVGQAVGLEEVVVTAQRREEKLQDVPVSVTAFTSRDLERAQIVDTKSLQVMVPNVTMSGGILGNADMIIGMRGVSAPSFNANSDTAVGFYVDGVYYARSAGSNLGLVDMERLEVLRGPQGTLFGRNTIAGAINITTQKPKDDFEGSIKVGAGNYNQLSANVVLNVPIIADKLAVRGVYDHQQHGGYGYNSFLHAPQSDQHQDYVRLSVDAHLTDSLDLLVTGDHFKSHANADLWVLRYFDPAIATLPANGRGAAAPYLCTSDCRTSATDWNPPNTGETNSVNATFTWNLGFATLKSISAYRDLNFQGGADVDGTPLRYVGSTYGDTQKQYSQEFQINGKALDDKLDWIGGLYYFSEIIGNPALVGTTVAGVQISTDNFFHGKNTSKSAFAQVSYEIIPNLKLTGGIRYVEDTRSASYTNVVLNPPVGYNGGAIAPLIVGGNTILPACRLPGPATGVSPPADLVKCIFSPPGTKVNYMPWTVGLDYKPMPDMLFYAKMSKGYRSGGFQLASGNVQAFQYVPFGPEKVLSYEGGTKLDLFDRRLRFNAAAFYTHYTNIQQNIPVFNSLTGVITPLFINAGVENVKGIELEMTALLGDLRLTGALGLSDPKFKSAPFNVNSLVAENPILVTKTTWSLAADYPLRLSEGTLNFHLDYGHQSRNYDYTPANVNVVPFGPLTAGQINSLSTGPFGLLNGTVSFALDKPDVVVTLWGRNLANTYYYFRSLSTYTQGYNAAHPGDPRTFGATVAYKF